MASIDNTSMENTFCAHAERCEGLNDWCRYRHISGVCFYSMCQPKPEGSGICERDCRKEHPTSLKNNIWQMKDGQTFHFIDPKLIKSKTTKPKKTLKGKPWGEYEEETQTSPDEIPWQTKQTAKKNDKAAAKNKATDQAQMETKYQSDIVTHIEVKAEGQAKAQAEAYAKAHTEVNADAHTKAKAKALKDMHEAQSKLNAKMPTEEHKKNPVVKQSLKSYAGALAGQSGASPADRSNEEPNPSDGTNLINTQLSAIAATIAADDFNPEILDIVEQAISTRNTWLLRQVEELQAQSKRLDKFRKMYLAGKTA